MRGKHILVVEDNPDAREACVAVLAALGYSVAAVDDGARALAELAQRRPEVILLDLIMPRAELDGLGFLSSLAANPASDVPIIIVSALGDPLADVLSPAVAGALHIAAVLSNPVPLDTLTREIDRLIGPPVPR